MSERRYADPHRQPRKRLTPAQKKAIMRRRRIKKLKRNLKFFVPAAILLVVAIVLIALPGRSGKDNVSTQTQLTQAETSVPETQETESSDQTVQNTVTEQETAEVESYAEAQTTAVPETNVSAAAAVSTEAFDFESNYVRAVKGETTGPVIQPNYTNVDSSKLDRWPEVQEGYMPIIQKGENVTEKIICITVDDCFQAENLKNIVQTALDNNGKLTIFPIGKNVAKSSIGSVIKWAWENGMELENHTYNHVGLYHFDDLRMEQELWYQNCELNELLGVNYTEHFFRPHGGDGRHCQRNHAYVNQLGMYGLAVWSVDGSKSSIEAIEKSLAPGEIYLFHTTDNDWNLLKQFIPYATAQGYTLVTMNEMFGLPDNETSELTITKDSTPPALQAFQIMIPTLKATSYQRAAAVVQNRLIELGWLTGEADGEFGKGCYQATGYFQQAMGLEADGIAGPETQKVLFSDEAKHK